MNTSKIKIVTDEQGKRQSVLGDNQRVIMTGADTGGSYALIENVNPPGIGIPMHRHRHEDEVFHLLEGRVEFSIGGETVGAEAGTTVHIPRGTAHSFRIVGDAPAKMRVMMIPAGLENYFEELSLLTADETPDMDKITGISNRYGIEFLSDSTE